MVIDIIKNSKIVVAPMAGFTDPPFRALCRDFGAKISYTEMISSVGVVKGDDKSRNFTFVQGEHPIAVQIFGSDPHIMADASKYFQDKGADIIDINLGCPVKKVAKQKAGASLARDINLVEAIIKKIKNAITIPLSIKIRLGWSPLEENYLDICKIAEDNGVHIIAIHPRYAVQQYTGTANWEKINDVRKFFTGILIGSGDIVSVKDIHERLTKYPVDAVMLGRALVGNPWLLSTYYNYGSLSLKDTIKKHLEYLVAFHGEKKAIVLFRKFLSKYLKGQPNAQELRILGNQAQSLSDMESILGIMHTNRNQHQESI
jgi:tRNA-dihydrouridine synthase B